MVTWASDGGLACFNASRGRPTKIEDEEVTYLLATNAMVDVEGVTRLHYALNDSMFLYSGFEPANDRIDARANFDFSASDISDLPAGWSLTASMFTVKASLFAAGHVPTPAEILALAEADVIVKRASDNTTVAGVHPFYITGPRAGAASDRLNPNTKYWCMVAPTRVNNFGSDPTLAHDVVIDTGKCRGLSMWTNRTPAAPTITSPLNGTTAPAGTVLSLALSTNDSDRVVGRRSSTYTDLEGVQVQYAPQPTVDTPTPVWADLPVGHPDLPAGVLLNDWYLFGSTFTGLDGSGGGAYPLVLGTATGGVQPLDCATTEPSEYGAQLPSGAWQIRARVFDFAHPYPALMAPWGLSPPAGESSLDITPDDAPAANTSPWSAPVYITISEEVPPPTPLSPINEVAVAEGAEVTLSWLYWNTYVPPFAQAERTIEIRKVGETDWTTLVSGIGGDPTYTIPAEDYPLEATNGYQWRVSVVDTNGVESGWSTVATFWVVPAPVSGPLRPVPSETISAATLGEGTHRVFIYRRGGKDRVGELTNVSYVDWNRVRDDISDAKIVVSSWTPDTADLLRDLQCWAYEVVIVRDNGFSKDRVWEGPITLLTYERDSVTINAKDVMAYAYRRIIKQAMNDLSSSSPTAGDTVVSRATRILQNVLAPDDPNVLSYLTPLIRTDDPKQYRSLAPYSKTAFEEVDDMAANAGLDYTCSGRSILLWSTKHRIGTLPEFRDSDLGSVPIVSEYGMSFADRYVVSDGNGIWGEATRGLDPVSGNEPSYGLVEMLSSTWANDSSEEVGSYTEEGIETIRESFTEYAERSIADRYPPPVVVRVPDNTTINADTVLSIQQLVPGVVIPLRSTGTLRSVVDNQKLDKVQVTETSGRETITITLSPFNRDDADTGEVDA